jgi:hypothetical protein
MKKLIGIALASLLLVAAQTRSEEPFVSPLLGTWAVDTSRLPVPPEARPKRVTIIFSQVTPGQLTTRVEVVDPTGALLVAEGTNELNGTIAPVSGNLEADTSAATMPAPTVLVLQLARANVPGSTRIYTVEPDGKSMVETAANFGANGQPVMRFNYFRRVE